jgi:hypothetical protein
MGRIPELPLSPADLQTYRLQANRLRRPGQLGAHLSRRKGQSLEFRDYTAYQPGADIKHVDWVASARNRHGFELVPYEHWLVKVFEVEDDLQLVVTLDTRPSLALPEAFPKRDAAAWLAEALAAVALFDGNRVWLHRAFGGRRGREVLSLRGCAPQAIGARVRNWIADVRETDEAAPPNIAALQRVLPPTAVWVVISDFYFNSGPDGRNAALIEQMARAQAHYRWVVAVELDSWPCERIVVGQGPRALSRQFLGSREPLRVEVDEAAVTVVDRRIRDHVHRHHARLKAARVDSTTWRWPAAAQFDGAAYFRRQFHEDAVLRRIFARQP